MKTEREVLAELVRKIDGLFEKARNATGNEITETWSTIEEWRFRVELVNAWPKIREVLARPVQPDARGEAPDDLLRGFGDDFEPTDDSRPNLREERAIRAAKEERCDSCGRPLATNDEQGDSSQYCTRRYRSNAFDVSECLSRSSTKPDARVEALEEAARICDAMAQQMFSPGMIAALAPRAALKCAAAIRAAKERE